MVFDIKIEDSRHKARLVAEGHMSEASPTVMCDSVVYKETVRIALMIDALNDLEVKLGDILNAFIQAPVTEKEWTTLGLVFGKDFEKTAVIVRVLYALTFIRGAF